MSLDLQKAVYGAICGAAFGIVFWWKKGGQAFEPKKLALPVAVGAVLGLSKDWLKLNFADMEGLLSQVGEVGVAGALLQAVTRKVKV